jgi:hypothetical protein
MSRPIPNSIHKDNVYEPLRLELQVEGMKNWKARQAAVAQCKNEYEIEQCKRAYDDLWRNGIWQMDELFLAQGPYL